MDGRWERDECGWDGGWEFWLQLIQQWEGNGMAWDGSSKKEREVGG